MRRRRWPDDALTCSETAQPVPAVLEIPSKDRPYDPSKARLRSSASDLCSLTSTVHAQDSILNRVKHLLGGPGGEA